VCRGSVLRRRLTCFYKSSLVCCPVLNASWPTVLVERTAVACWDTWAAPAAVRYWRYRGPLEERFGLVVAVVPVVVAVAVAAVFPVVVLVGDKVWPVFGHYMGTCP